MKKWMMLLRILWTLPVTKNHCVLQKTEFNHPHPPSHHPLPPWSLSLSPYSSDDNSSFYKNRGYVLLFADSIGNIAFWDPMSRRFSLIHLTVGGNMETSRDIMYESTLDESVTDTLVGDGPTVRCRCETRRWFTESCELSLLATSPTRKSKNTSKIVRPDGRLDV